MEEIQKPQFILWDQKNGWAGVFRIAELIETPFNENEKRKVSYDFLDHYELKGSPAPSDLSLLSSSYMGPTRVIEKSGKENPNFRHRVVNNIVECARDIAQKTGVQYFSVTNFISHSDMRKIENKTLEEQLKEIKVTKPGKEILFVFHPTAQLYIPR